jgi:hypothetical protein
LKGFIHSGDTLDFYILKTTQALCGERTIKQLEWKWGEWKKD